MKCVTEVGMLTLAFFIRDPDGRVLKRHQAAFSERSVYANLAENSLLLCHDLAISPHQAALEADRNH